MEKVTSELFVHSREERPMSLSNRCNSFSYTVDEKSLAFVHVHPFFSLYSVMTGGRLARFRGYFQHTATNFVCHQSVDIHQP